MINKMAKDAEGFYFNRAVNAKSSESTRHYHTTYEIYCLTEGRCSYFIDDSFYDVAAGDVILIPNGVIHRTNYSDDCHSRLLVNFPKEMIPEGLKDVLLDTHYRAGSAASKVRELMELIEEEYENLDTYSEEALTLLVGRILFTLFRSKGEAAPARNDGGSLVERVVKHMRENYMYDLRLNLVAKEFAVSSEHLSRIFKKHTGFGFNEYLTLLRLQRAEFMLVNEPGKSVGEIAYSCGFNDGNYFSHRFKTTYGVSPSELRKKSGE